MAPILGRTSGVTVWGSVKKSSAAPDAGIEATGGTISEYTDGSFKYRAHIFNEPGTFGVTELGDVPPTVDYLIVGAGGPGGYNYGGGGGGGAVKTGQLTATVSNYPVTVGGGSRGASQNSPSWPTTYIRGATGESTTFNSVTAEGGGAGGGAWPTTSPFADIIAGESRPEASGGGGGGIHPTAPGPAGPGGSGGPEGNNGAAGVGYQGGGGGGAGGAGSSGPAPQSPQIGGAGGAGVSNDYATGSNLLYGGGGGGGTTHPGNHSSGGPGGGGDGGSWNDNKPTVDGMQPGFWGTGGGGGGGGNQIKSGGIGGNGTVIVRYKIGAAQAGGTAKATGGYISYYNSKAIHVFYRDGDFNNTTGAPLSVEYVIVGGGGRGGGAYPPGKSGGGGGAGQYLTATGNTVSPGPNSVVVGRGGHAGFANARIEPWNPMGPGAPSSFNGITANGGGSGGQMGESVGWPGGSGGGAYGGGGPSDGGTATPGPGGNDGAATSDTGPGGAGGGGGAGGAGTSPGPTTTHGGGPGGAGIQLPTTFQNPENIVGTPTFYVAGGGGGEAMPNPGYPSAYRTGGTGGSGGGGDGADTPTSGVGPTAAQQGTGSGGGAGGNIMPGNPYEGNGGTGGSGVVLIAYPI